MGPPADYLPLIQTVAPSTQDDLRAAVAEAFAAGTPVYPIGGGTALDFGLPGKRPGNGLSLAGVPRVVDYPARDMTITVEAGISIKALRETLATERQCLPIDAADEDRATLGGLVATNFSGPHRLGSGTLRDYVIGISAVDGRGMAYKAGGRVVKNVAGYDLCKLLTGSLGTVGVITQITLKVKPLPERSVLVAAAVRDLADADRLLAGLTSTRTTPAAIELLLGPAWHGAEELGPFPQSFRARLVAGLEGTAAEVAWMIEQLKSEWSGAGVGIPHVVEDEAAAALWRKLTDFPADRSAPLVLKAAVLPSRMLPFIETALAIDRECSITAHAGSGIVIARFPNFPAGDVGKLLPGKLQPAARTAGGHATVLSWNGGGELTRQAFWGNLDAAGTWMQAVKQEFDPKNILNPGRFVFG